MKALLFILLMTTTVQAHAQKIGACKTQDQITEKNPAQLKEMALQNFERKKYCLAAAQFLRFSLLAENPKERFWAFLMQAESYFNNYDYENFSHRALWILEQKTDFTDQNERVHFLLMKALWEQSLEWKDISNPSVQYLLGIHPEQLNETSPKNSLKLRAFLEKYPHSIYQPEVLSMQLQIRSLFNEDYAEKARRLWAQREYAPAIARYQFLISQGPQNKDLDLHYYELLAVLSDFEFWISDLNKVPNEKLARWMITSAAQINSDVRQRLKTQLFEQRRFLLIAMQKNLPQSNWTKKAIQEHLDALK